MTRYWTDLKRSRNDLNRKRTGRSLNDSERRDEKDVEFSKETTDRVQSTKRTHVEKVSDSSCNSVVAGIRVTGKRYITTINTFLRFKKVIINLCLVFMDSIYSATFLFYICIQRDR